jgi:hypothetical protein
MSAIVSTPIGAGAKNAPTSGKSSSWSSSAGRISPFVGSDRAPG